MTDTETNRDWCIECPHCFHKHRDVCDYNHGEHPHQTECEDCGKPFRYWTETVTHYHADKLEAASHD